jgi:hypothetical protein
MEGEHQDNKHEEILERIEQMDARLKETQNSVRRMSKFMYWRLVIILVAILVPTIAIPIFIKVFIDSFFIPEYIEYFQSFF